MSDDILVEALEKIRAIIDDALAHRTRRVRARKSEGKSNLKRKTSMALPDHIIGLRDSGFLKQPKTADEIHAKLQPTYHCKLNRVAMALLRLHKKRALRKASKIVGKRKLLAYVA
jgi:hypothetical protein